MGLTPLWAPNAAYNVAIPECCVAFYGPTTKNSGLCGGGYVLVLLLDVY